MASFKAEVPYDLIKQFEGLEKNSDDMLSEMTHAGAEIIFNNIKSNAPASLKKSDIMNHLKITKVYKTPSDGGINCKVAFYGYYINHKGVRTPVPLVVNLFEFGGSKFKKQPFIRKSYKKQQVEEAMLKVQSKYIKEE